MLDRFIPLPLARRLTNLQRLEAMAQAESTRDILIQLEQSLLQLASIERLLQLRVQWNPEQAQRQQERLVRQQARLHRQQAMLGRLQNEPER